MNNDIFVLNNNFESAQIIDTYKSLIWTDRYYESGDFEVTIPVETYQQGFIFEDYYLYFKKSEHMMIIEGISVNSDPESGNVIILTGRSLESILDRRIVWGQENVKGKLQDEIKRLIEENIINPTDTKRKIDKFIFEVNDDVRFDTMEVDAQFTGQSLYDIIHSLCIVEHVGFKITMDEDDNFIFKLYKGIDRSYRQDINPYVKFSPEFENIINSEYLTSTLNYKNVTLVAGEGEGTNRKTVEVGTTEGILRREIYTDARDVSSTSNGQISSEEYLELLKARGQENLEEYKYTKVFDGEFHPSGLYEYDQDFFIGDLVEVGNEFNQNGTARIIEYIFSDDDTGSTSYPTFDILDEEEE